MIASVPLLALFLTTVVVLTMGEHSFSGDSDKAKFELFYAASKGDLPRVKSLVESGVDINAAGQPRDGYTALFGAALWNFPDIVEWLLDHGADTKVKDRKGFTAFQLAVHEGHKFVVKAFLAKGISEKDAGPDGMYGMHRAVAAGKEPHQVIIDEMLEAGFNINIKSEKGVTPLMTACNLGLLRMARHLAAKGADMNVQDNLGRTALHYAVTGYVIKQAGNETAYKTYLEEHKDDPSGFVPTVSESESKRYYNIMKTLTWDHNANPDIKDSHGESASDVMFVRDLSEDQVFLKIFTERPQARYKGKHKTPRVTTQDSSAPAPVQSTGPRQGGPGVTIYDEL